VVVLGAGNVAMDSARTAMRLGAETVKIVYRRSRDEMPARKAEIHHAEEEGIEMCLLTNPTRYLGNERAGLPAWSACAWNWVSPTTPAGGARWQ